jgi:hypothetical protein
VSSPMSPQIYRHRDVRQIGSRMPATHEVARIEGRLFPMSQGIIVKAGRNSTHGVLHFGNSAQRSFGLFRLASVPYTAFSCPEC